nr:MAG TPA: hypothetical protein [Caudoviricetes sp.]
MYFLRIHFTSIMYALLVSLIVKRQRTRMLK